MNRKIKYIYTLILPTGKEIVIGAFTSFAKAQALLSKELLPDYQELCVGPLQQRYLKTGEKVKHGDIWKGNESVPPN